MALPKLSASEYLRRVRRGEEVPNRVVNIHPVGDASWRAYVYTIPPGYHPLATGDAAYFATPTRSTRLEAARDLLAHKAVAVGDAVAACRVQELSTNSTGLAVIA